MSATTERPFFRTDLVSRPIQAAGHRFIEVTDPDSGHSFRFYEIEYAIACAMDGERDVDELADWAKYELGVDPSRDEIESVIGTLGDLGYLDAGETTADHGEMAEAAARADARRDPAPTEPAPLDRPPPAGRIGGEPGSPFDLPRDRSSQELSTDLSEHLPVRAADVKEAVRQSRAIQVQKPPIEVIDEDEGFDDERTPVPAVPATGRAAAAAAAAAPSAGRRAVDASGRADVARAEAARAEAVRTDTSSPALSAALGKTLLGTMAPAQPPRAAGGRSSTPAPVVLPEMPTEISSSADSVGEGPTTVRRPDMPSAAPPARPAATARDSAVQPMLPAGRSGGLLPYLIVLLLLSGAGALAYWWFFVREGDTVTGEAEAPPTAPSAVEMPSGATGAGAQVPADPPSPPEIAATLEAGPTEEQAVAAPRPGLVAWLAPSGTEVSEGAPVAKYDGFQRWDYAVKEAQDSQKRYQEKLDQATSKGDKDAMKEAEGNVKRKQGDIDRNVAELEKFLVAAPIGGVVEPVVKPRSQVKKDEPVAKILATSAPRASFPIPAGAPSPIGDVKVVAKSDPSLGATCKVVSSDDGTLVVTCPTDSGLASGTEVVLKL